MENQETQSVQPVQQQAIPAASTPPAQQAPVVSVSDWMITLLIMAIPIVNIIMMFIWAFSPETNPSKANYFKASLIWAAIWIGVIILFMILFVGIFASLFNSYY